ncbi:MAG: DUF1801 domain-containing protein [Pseudomonadota bacterium]
MTNLVDEWIDQAGDWQQRSLQQLRAVILAAVPDANEAMKWGQPCYSRNGLFCYLQRSKQHVTLGFQKGARMNDPEGLLEGDGKQMRHLKFDAQATIDEERCAGFIMEAIRLD